MFKKLALSGAVLNSLARGAGTVGKSTGAIGTVGLGGLAAVGAAKQGVKQGKKDIQGFNPLLHNYSLDMG